MALGMRLLAYGKESKRGRAVGGEVGIYIRRNPDIVRAAEDRMSRMREKLRDYFSAGVLVVWLVDPGLRRVLVYRSPTEMTVLDEQQMLTDEELLPGFNVPISELFSA
jgi:hypothetical protein